MKIGVGHPALPGHFPGNPIVPGVVILGEVLLAAGGLIGRPVRITGLPSVKFSAPLLPGEEFEVIFEPKGEGRAGFAVRSGTRTFVTGIVAYEALHAG